jgi:murein DD-endopeptidase MepM/ murein hydrolase activator NlpD
MLLAFAVPATAVSGETRAVGSSSTAVQQRETTLSAKIDSLTVEIRDLEARTGDVSTRLASLQNDLALHRRRLQTIDALLGVQSSQLRFLQHELAVARTRLDERLVEIYENGEPSTIEVVLGASSLEDALNRTSYANEIAREDKEIAASVAATRARVRAAHARATRLRASVASATRIIAYRTQQARALRARLLEQRAGTARALASARSARDAWIAEAQALQKPSSSIAGQVASSRPTPQTPPSSAGLIWPVSGPITSPFGMRWGKLHPGIDISAPTGTPIRAAASGRVVSAGRDGGYGNLTVIDHGNGLATAYAHQSRLGVSAGQAVVQGQVIGDVGSTGFSTGPHLHFEVRVDGSPVDPMGYL